MSTWLKKTILYAVVVFAVLSAISSYNREPDYELVTESFEVLTLGQQLIRVDVSHYCGDWIHYACDETNVSETEHYGAEDLEVMSNIFAEVLNEEDICTVNELELTLIGVGM